MSDERELPEFVPYDPWARSAVPMDTPAKPFNPNVVDRPIDYDKIRHNEYQRLMKS